MWSVQACNLLLESEVNVEEGKGMRKCRLPHGRESVLGHRS